MCVKLFCRFGDIMFVFYGATTQLEPSSPVFMFVGHTQLNARKGYDPAERASSS
jgi:hypothetical protein